MTDGKSSTRSDRVPVEEVLEASEAFSRVDDADDGVFYSNDRFVSHLDSEALATVKSLIDRIVRTDDPVILDLMASWDSHLPESLQPARVAGLGLNKNELEKNEALTERVIHDLNRNSSLPFPDATFDAVLCTVSVDYMTKPVDVFADVHRILKPGGVFLVIFSNRFFPEKVVRIWKEIPEDERVFLVQEYFRQAGGFGDTRVFVSRGKPRPADDKYSGLGLLSDPVFAVFAYTAGSEPGDFQDTRDAMKIPDPEELERRKKEVKRTLRCPYCEEKLLKWEVPQHIWTEWPNEFFQICFNDQCGYYLRGWDAMARQNNHGSYRLMYDSLTDSCGPMPVFDSKTLRDGIIE